MKDSTYNQLLALDTPANANSVEYQETLYALLVEEQARAGAEGCEEVASLCPPSLTPFF
jgi:hypothetical protein